MKTTKILLPFSLSAAMVLCLLTGCKKDDTGTYYPDLPVIEITGISRTSNSISFSFSIEGIYTISQYGVCWSKTPNPKIFNDHTSETNTYTSPRSTVTGLSTDTGYYFRAYAMNEGGIDYSEEVYCRPRSTDLPLYVPVQGLQAWWPFTDNAMDLSGHGNDGYINGPQLTNDRSGFSFEALYFKGPGTYGYGDFVNINNTCGNFTTYPFTVSLWVLDNDNDSVTNRVLISKRNSSGYGNFWLVSYLDHPGYEINQTNSSDYSNGHVGGSYLDAWHHIVMVRNGTSISLYMDGVLKQAFVSPINQSINNSAPLTIGNTYRGYSYQDFFKGCIDDVGLWNRALTPEEITALYNGN